MIKNYLRVAFRNLWRHKGFSLLNIIGLTVGMAAFFLVFLYVTFELSYDSALSIALATMSWQAIKVALDPGKKFKKRMRMQHFRQKRVFPRPGLSSYPPKLIYAQKLSPHCLPQSLAA